MLITGLHFSQSDVTCGCSDFPPIICIFGKVVCLGAKKTVIMFELWSWRMKGRPGEWCQMLSRKCPSLQSQTDGENTQSWNLVCKPKVMVIVWRLKRIILTANVLPLQWAQLTKTVHTARLGREFVFVFFGCMISLYVHVCFVLPGSVESLHVLALA